MTDLTLPVEESESTRKLAAIMFTDIKGFSRKMGENESEAFELLKTHDALMRVLTAKFGGKVIKSIGDSFMVDFSSAVNAVKCAVEVQKRFWTFNQGKSEFHRIEIRIGIHLGDVLIRGDDIYGDGVNIAQRIEAITEPNRICFSQDIYNQVRNKMKVNVHKMGAIDLKNIAEPVEIYEVLIDTIPALASPSATALDSANSRRGTDASEQVASDEALEARSIEEARRRSGGGSLKEEEKKKVIENHYQRAEKFFELGHYADAEKELAEIYKLDPNFDGAGGKREEDEENEKHAQIHLKQARDQITEGKLDEAETSLNEVFRNFPLHMGAHQILLQIEEARYKKEEEERRKTEKKVSAVVTEEEKKIAALLEKARKELEQEQFQEAIFTLRDLFVLDPNDSEARRLEETIHHAEEAKREMDRVRVDQEEQQQQANQLAALQKKLQDQRAKETQVAPPPPQKRRKINYKLIAQVLGSILVAGFLFLTVPRLIRSLFPNTLSLAVVVLAEPDVRNGDIAYALPALLTEDFARCNHVTVVASTSAATYEARPGNLAQLASALSVRQIITLGATSDSTGIFIAVRAFDAPSQSEVYRGRFESQFTTLHQTRAQIVAAVLEAFDVDSDIPVISRPVGNPAAYESYLRGSVWLPLRNLEGLRVAESWMRDALTREPAFPLAQVGLADALLQQVRLGAAERPALDEAADLLDRALRQDEGLAEGHRAMGTLHRLMHRYTRAGPSLRKSIQLQAANPEAYRELALLTMVGGNVEEALRHAGVARQVDPKHPSTHFTLGVIQHYQKRYAEATAGYEEAIRLGMEDGFVRSRFLVQSWIGQDQHTKSMQFYTDLVNANPTSYRLMYLLGRSYQLAVRLDESQSILERGLSMARDATDRDRADANAFAYIGLFQSRLGRFAEGEAAMKRALELNSNSTELLYRQANLYSIQKRNPEAFKALREAVARRYDLAEIFNPDFVLLSKEPDFPSVIARTLGE